MGRERLTGLGVSPGRAAGPVRRMAAPPTLPATMPAVTDAAGERERAAGALRAVAAELAARAASASGTAAAVLEAESLMAVDPTLVAGVADRVSHGRPAAWAISEAIAEQRAVLGSLGGHLAERAADLDDIRDRAVAHLLGQPMPGMPDPGHPFVLVADDLAPADTARLDPSTVLALVTRRGGPTSHTAILARAHGLPAVVACPRALELTEGSLVSVDGTTGEVAPVDADEVVRVQRVADRARRGAASHAGPGRTADGHLVPLLLNVGGVADLAGQDHAEGVGLFRTELLFLDRADMPTRAEQEHAYADLFARMSGRKVVLRTLDAGADKPLPFLGLDREENPALGVRGLRVARTHPDVLATQLDAVADAAAATAATVWVMAPMVATAEEAARFVDAVRAAGLPVAGVMVEIPAAALRARQLLDVVDFLSIGTNDLAQYTVAADRASGALADLLDPWQPAVLHLVAGCAEAGREAGKPVGVCGESAADPLLALVLVGLGITSLSMSAPSVPAVRAALARHTLADCQRLAELARDAPTAITARRAVTDHASTLS